MLGNAKQAATKHTAQKNDQLLLSALWSGYTDQTVTQPYNIDSTACYGILEDINKSSYTRELETKSHAYPLKAKPMGSTSNNSLLMSSLIA